jgi:hypothetical protein
MSKNYKNIAINIIKAEKIQPKFIKGFRLDLKKAILSFSFKLIIKRREVPIN